MPHRRSLRVQARRACGALVLSLLASGTACARRASVTVLVDTTSTGGSLEVFALPVSPERLAVSLPDGPMPAAGTPRGDSIARLLALADSADALDARFQRRRDALNDEALEMAEADRFSDDYATRYDAHRTALLEAERLRNARDRLRDRAHALRERLGEGAPPDAVTRRAREREARRTAFIAATDAERTAHVVATRTGAATLELSPGAWWLGVANAGSVPETFRRLEVPAGARDTVRLAAP